jgi:hypothetical protein
MARNRRVQSAEVQFGPALKALLICVLIGGAAVGYVHQQHQFAALRDEERDWQGRNEELQRRIVDLTRQKEQLYNNEAVRQAVTAWGLGDMELVQPGQVISLRPGDSAPPGWAPNSPDLVQQSRQSQGGQP